MSELSSINGLRVDVDPMVGRAVRWRVLNTQGCGALVARRVTRIGARP
jgi:hypothetical protein